MDNDLKLIGIDLSQEGHNDSHISDMKQGTKLDLE